MHGITPPPSFDRGGFVFVEVLVVIIILALLVAILIFGLSNLSTHK
jgi:prepilin-type N-terminal cleavage/methylation domain-containing protein